MTTNKNLSHVLSRTVASDPSKRLHELNISYFGVVISGLRRGVAAKFVTFPVTAFYPWR